MPGVKSALSRANSTLSPLVTKELAMTMLEDKRFDAEFRLESGRRLHGKAMRQARSARFAGDSQAAAFWQNRAAYYRLYITYDKHLLNALYMRRC